MTDSRAVNFSTAGLGGVMAWWLVHPFNTIAVRMSLANASVEGGLQTSFPRYTMNVVKNEGAKSLFKGIGAGTMRQVFYATSRFGLFEVFRDKLAEFNGGNVDFTIRLVAGCVSGGCAAIISSPAEVSLVRMSNDMSLPADKRMNYRNVFDAMMRTARNEGVMAFWNGSMPFCYRCIIVGACQVGTYDQFRSYFQNSWGLERNRISNVFLSANLAALFYSLITMPLETTKNRMAFQKKLPDGTKKYRTTVQSIVTIARSEGVLALWNGYIPYYARCGGHTVTMFVLVELLRKTYKNYVSQDPQNALSA